MNGCLRPLKARDYGANNLLRVPDRTGTRIYRHLVCRCGSAERDS